MLPLPCGRLHGDAAAEQVDELAHERQPDAGTLARPAVVAAVELSEAVEDEVEVLLGDADAGVGDRHRRSRRRRRVSRSEMRPRAVNFRAFDEQVEHDALEHVDVDVGVVVELVADDVELETRALDGRSEVRGDPGHQLLDVGRDPVRLDRPGLDAGEVEDAVHETGEAVGVAADQLEALALLGVEAARRRGRPAPGLR